MNSPEFYGKIVCAALYKNNTIYMGDAHYQIFPLEPIGILRDAVQGFVTENGYFVDRNVGLQIAIYYNQIESKHGSSNELYSEDLKKEGIILLKRLKDVEYKAKNGV